MVVLIFIQDNPIAYYFQFRLCFNQWDKSTSPQSLRFTIYLCFFNLAPQVLAFYLEFLSLCLHRLQQPAPRTLRHCYRHAQRVLLSQFIPFSIRFLHLLHFLLPIIRTLMNFCTFELFFRGYGDFGR